MCPIEGLSERRRLPRLGKIHLGVKEKTTTPCKCKQETADKKPRKDCRLCLGTGFVFRPKEVDYFVCPPEVREVYGEMPKVLPIMFPVEDPQLFFQQWYMRYGFGVIKCIGDGVNARTWDEEISGFKTIKCPCDYLNQRKCARQAILQFLLYELPGAGVWQIRTGSKNSIIDINSGIDYIKSMCERIRMIPLLLKREETTVSRTEKKRLKASTHYTLKLDLASVSLKQLLQYAQVPPSRIFLPPPDMEEDPLYYPPAGWPKEGEEVVEAEAEEVPPEKPESPAHEKEKKAFEETELNILKRDIKIYLGRIEEAGGTLTAAELKFYRTLTAKEDHKKALEELKQKLAELEGDKKEEGEQPSLIPKGK